MGRRQQVSRDGGWEPVWSRDGREIFYHDLDGRHMMAVSVAGESGLPVGEPRVLFEEPDTAPPDFVFNAASYDVAPDGRFLMISQTEASQTPMKLVVVQNWFQELERLVPTPN